jgi:hypothetical protein
MAKTIDAEWIEPQGATLLFEAWLSRLSHEQLGLDGSQVGQSGVTRTVVCGDATGAHFAVRESGLEVELETSVDVAEEDALRIIDAALSKVASRDLGGVIVYRTELAIQEFDFFSSTHFMRALGDQVHVEGARRLAGVALLDFPEGLLASEADPGLIFLPSSEVPLTVFAEGPVQSNFTAMAAAGLTEVVAAICAFATGRPVRFEVPRFALDENASREALSRQSDVSIPNLARDSISLDIFGDLAMVGGTDAILRARGSLLAYHAALNQSSPDVAIMLLVTSMEALIAPRPPWGKSKVTVRFIKAILDLCPDAVDDIIEHANVGQAFGYVKKGKRARQRKEILDLIYEARSIPTHTGPSLARSGVFDLASSGSMRVALLSDLARAALLSYLKAPRSFLVGNPALEQAEQDR